MPTCEAITYRRSNEGTVCREPAAYRLDMRCLGDGGATRTMYVCAECRPHAEDRARVGDRAYIVTATPLLDTPEGHIARIEDALLDAVRDVIGDYRAEPLRWLNNLLVNIEDCHTYQRDSLFERIASDPHLREARDEAWQFFDEADAAEQAETEAAI